MHASSCLSDCVRLHVNVYSAFSFWFSAFLMKPKANGSVQNGGGFFRGIAAAIRAKMLGIKQGIRAVGEVENLPLKYTSPNDVFKALTITKILRWCDCCLLSWWQARALAFSSEVGVAGKSQLNVNVYRATWGLSIAALVADITTKCFDAPEEKIPHTVCWTTPFVCVHLRATFLSFPFV